ncbi:MAG: hypothetical protein JNL19_00600 [Burkholderiales bacterium]|nr:hypothetical protein [Burkholderiales bacterium]
MSAGTGDPAPELSTQLGALLRARQLPELLARWDAASDAQRSPAAARSAAIALAELRRLDDAQAVIDRWLSDAGDVATRVLVARVAFDLGHYRTALDRIEPVIALGAMRPSWWIVYLRAAVGCGEAERALRQHAAYATLVNGDAAIGRAHAELLAMAGNRDAAMTAFDRLMQSHPEDATLAATAREFFLREFPERADLALDNLRQLAAKPVLSPEAVRHLNMLPAFYRDDASASLWRDTWIAAVRALTLAAQQSPLRGDERARCLATTPFLLAYHDADITAAQCAWGDFVDAIAAPLRVPPKAARRGTPRRVGIVSNRLNQSSAGRFFNAWIDDLLAAGFEVRLYAVGPNDDVTARLAARTPLQYLGVDEIHRWAALRDALLRDENDALVFPEPQGSPLMLLVAALRCAPIQCAGYGNPLSTGLPTMDYFLAPDAAEVPAPAPYYRERVVRLAGMGTRIEPPPLVAARTRDAFGLSDDDHYYLVSQQLQKWSPSFVETVMVVLQRDPRARIVRFPHGSAGVSSLAFDSLLRARCRDAGVAMDERFVTRPWMTWLEFLALHHAMDVSLDTWPFSGGSTTVDALAQGLPVVTHEGAFLRGRQSAALLRARGADDCVLPNRDQVATRAIELATNRRRLARIDAPRHAGGSSPNVFATLADFLRSL